MKKQKNAQKYAIALKYRALNKNCRCHKKYGSLLFAEDIQYCRLSTYF